MTRSWWAALVVSAMLLTVLAAPISAAQGATTLSGAVVSPRTGTIATTVVITVVYENQNGSRADSVIARIGESDKVMTADPGGDWGSGVTFRWSGTLPLGTHAIDITATARNHDQVSLSAGTVTIGTIATPTPRPTPTPTPRPTPTPTPRPTPTPTPRPTTTATAAATPAGTPATPRPTAGVAGETPSPTTGVPGPTDGHGPDASSVPADGSTPVPTASILPVTAVALPPATTGGSTPRGSTGTSTGGGPARHQPGDPAGGWGPAAAAVAFAGIHLPALPSFSLIPTVVTTSGAVATAMAFGLFGKRRRDEDDDATDRDQALARAAASGIGVPGDLAGALALAIDAIEAPVAANGDDGQGEDSLPRWRRPSLLQARKTDPIRDNTPAARLTFDRGLVGPLDGRERRIIRYRVVRLLDAPDELRGAELGYLDRGDEVQLLEKYGAYWLVLAPDGQQGWLHKMTLGDVVGAETPVPDGPVATMPIAADSWTMGEADSAGDAFDSYLESRRRGD